MPEFDPDKCSLSKAQILEIGDILIERWQADKSGNRKMIVIARGLQFLLKHSPTSAVEQYYREAFKMVYFVMQKNAHNADPVLRQLPAPTPPPITYVQKEEKAETKLNFLKYVRAGGLSE